MAFYSVKKPLQELSEDARAALILAASPAITYVYDLLEERSVYQNRGLEDLLGYPAADHAESAWARLMHQEDQAKFAAHREQMRTLTPGKEITWEYRLKAPDGTWRWFMSRDVLLSSDTDGRPHLIVGTASDITAMKDAQRAKDLLFEEERHRTKNFTTVMLAIAQQSGPRPGEPAGVAFDRFVGRLRAILEAGNLVLAKEGRTANIRDVVDTSLAPLVSDMSRVAIEGPALELSDRVAGGLMLSVHELTTNALKYGALSAEGGTIAIRWRLAEGTGRVHFEWIEHGGPAVLEPVATGFGTRLLRTVLPENELAQLYVPEGLTCTFAFDALQSPVPDAR